MSRYVLTVRGLDPEVLEAVAATCVRCWRAEHPPPRDPDEIGRYRRAMVVRVGLEGTAVGMAVEDGWDGSWDELQLAAHREMYARGDDAQLARALRHVR